MSFAHFCMDMQVGELGKFGNPADVAQLTDTVMRLKRVTRRMGITTVNVAFIPRIKPIISDFRTVQQHVLRHNGPNLRDNSHVDAFGIPMHDREITAVKNGPSIATSSEAMQWLDQSGIDTVLLSGLWENQLGPHNVNACVSASAVDLARKYRTIIVSEATDISNDSANYWFYQLMAEKRVDAFRDVNVHVMPFETVRALIKRECATAKAALT